MSYGIKVSRPGVDVKTAADKDLSLSSERTAIKCSRARRMVVVCEWNGTYYVGTNSIAHDLGRVPFVMAFIEYGGAFYQLPMSTDIFYTQAEISVNSTSLSVTVYPDAADSFNIYYFLSAGDAIA